jgi:eukaryotic-like serine/threonine-protein kinase
MVFGSPAPGPSGSLPPGTRLNGIYEVETPIGRGGMGEVYRGRVIETGDLVAIKVLKGDFAQDGTAMALFRKEASALHHLHHDAIVRYFVFTIDPVLQRPYLAMELVEGPSLAEVLRNGPLGFDAARTLMRRVASGLQAAHERGIIHRDISPDNIILPGHDPSRARILDFGIAKSGNLGGGTVIGDGFAGKYGYVSPEQLGLFDGTVTPRSDIYSLGLVIAQALRGQAIPMGTTQAEVLDRRRSVPDLAEIDERIRPLLTAMLQPDAKDRPASMEEIATWSPSGRRAEAEPVLRGAPRLDFEDAKKPSRGKLVAAILLVAILLGAAAYVAVDRFVLSPDARRTASAPDLQAAAPPPLGAPAAPAPEAAAQADAPAAPPAPQLQPAAPEPAPPASAQDSASLEPAPAPSSAAPAAPPAVPSLTPSPEPPKEAAATTPPAPVPAPVPTPQPAEPAPQVALQAPAGQQAVAPPPAPATEPVRPSAPASSPEGGAERARRFLASFEGGDCFAAFPVEVGDSSARVEGYAASLAPFQKLDRDFTASNGFEAKIQVGKVSAAQCPAVGLLARLGGRPGGPQITVARDTLRRGDTLAGTIEPGSSNATDLVLVKDDGSVQTLAPYLKPGSPMTFSVPLDKADPGPLLLVALGSATPQPVLRQQKAAPADRVFPALERDLAGSGQKALAAARLIKVER